jgi:hypothetical protein
MKKLSILLILTILFVIIFPTIVYAATDIGSDATDRVDKAGADGYTIINLNTPIAASGTIITAEVWAYSDMQNFRVGIFYNAGGDSYTCRSSTASLGTVTAGSKQTFTDLTLTANAGDFIGCYSTTGEIEKTNSGSGNAWYYGNKIGVGNNDTYNISSNTTISLGGYAAPSYVIPTVTTQAVSSIDYTSATGNGNITDTGGEDASKRGICYSKTTNPPTVSDSIVEETGTYGTGAFTESLTGLDSGAFYYVRAYAYNSAGYGYGSTVTFTSLTQPILAEVLWYQPDNIISGTTLPDRDSTQDGIITWGSNPVGISNSSSVLISNGSIGTSNKGKHDTAPAINPDVSGIDKTQSDNLITQFLSPIADLTNFPLWILFMLFGVVAEVLVMMYVAKHTQNQMLSGGAGLVITFGLYKLGIFDWWMFFIPIIFFIAILVMERKPSL